MEAVALYDFAPTTDDELPFKKKSVLKVLVKSEDENWYKAEQFGRVGLVPANYIQMKEHTWFHKDISRGAAESILGDKQDGEFLIRNSESSPGDFSLSVKFPNGVQHYKILRDGAGKYFLWVVKFDSIHALIDYHRTSSVSRTEQVLLRDANSLNSAPKVKAMYDYRTDDCEELPFQKGDIIEILDQSDPDWWKGKHKNTKREGLIPANYVAKC